MPCLFASSQKTGVDGREHIYGVPLSEWEHCKAKHPNSLRIRKESPQTIRSLLIMRHCNSVVKAARAKRRS